MYTVVLFCPLITLIQTSNWLYSLGWACAFIYPISRCRKEERLMQEVFGEQYRDYMASVGPFFPFPIPFWGNLIVDDYTPVSVNDDDEHSPFM